PVPLPRKQFASDNYAGVTPEAWEAMAQANHGHAPAYGEDAWTARAADMIRELFETDCEVFFAFNGTAANSLALAAMCQSYHSILCHEISHIETDECGAPEFFSNGTKLLLLPGQNGKLDPEAIEHAVKRRSDVHYPKPRVLSLTQSTELGTVYSTGELDRLGETAKRLGLAFHMDGARFGNAVVHLGVAPKEITWRRGVDVLCFGGTKMGMAVGEAIVFFRKELAREFEYRCKQAGQLSSKMRFLAAPWIGMLKDDAWLRHARHANDCASRLSAGLSQLPGAKLMAPTDANAVFATLPETAIKMLKEKNWRFYTFIGTGGARFMCAWDTREADVQELLSDIGQALQAGGNAKP
ncbi:MAG TPA: low specificity L-threonine aldolase, partial [Rhizomicrobium sp.]|nr:low specificity L-threonine aldolase [Rhizomicrobium sp.]